MYIAILGRQPELGAAELERLYGNVTWVTSEAVRINSDAIELQRLGGTLKAGKIVHEFTARDFKQASQKIAQAFVHDYANFEGKITLGISAYGFRVNPRDVQKTGLIIKSRLKDSGVSVRLIPNSDSALATATSHHNKLGLSDNKIELIVLKAKNDKVVLALSVGAQNITAYAKRDQNRPKRDAFVGMLPPKLAQMMINMTGLPLPESSETAPRILDPFCGTGVILQEALLMGFSAYGTDLQDKMVDYTIKNLEWLNETHRFSSKDFTVHQGDAMETHWQTPIAAVACESYLGQPFSAPPRPEKLNEVRKNCNHIITSFLRNIAPQLAPGTPLCIAVPAWRNQEDQFVHLPLIDSLETYGFTQVSIISTHNRRLMYYREDQVVARELLILRKK